MMPECVPGVYAFVGGSKVFYVGTSTSLRRRTVNHPLREQCLDAGATELRWVELRDGTERQAVELLAIRAYRPTFNKSSYGNIQAQMLAESNFGETLQLIADEMLEGCRKPKQTKSSLVSIPNYGKHRYRRIA